MDGEKRLLHTWMEPGMKAIDCEEDENVVQENKSDLYKLLPAGK